MRALARRLAAIALLLLLALFVLRAWQSMQGPQLQAWHKIVPTELDADDIRHADWNRYVAAESRMFDQVHRDLQQKMEPGDRTPINRYNDGSLASPMAFGQDWNRSCMLMPVEPPRGVAVLLHGLTDAPYSMRSLAELYRSEGFIAIVPRMPGHGTVPAGLTREGRKEWEATVEMAMAEATRRAGGRLPVHLVGYSNGGALALLHVMRRIGNGERSDVQRIVLLSPMIEVNAFARYAGLAGIPAFFGRYAQSAWLDVLPEFNAFKYNSFPVRAARESYLVTSDLQAAMAAVVDRRAMGQVPPILAFQSVVDDTVTAQAVMTRLFDRLPANGSELVLFDVHRGRVIDPILRPTATAWMRDALQGHAALHADGHRHGVRDRRCRCRALASRGVVGHPVAPTRHAVTRATFTRYRMSPCRSPPRIRCTATSPRAFGCCNSGTSPCVGNATRWRSRRTA